MLCYSNGTDKLEITCNRTDMQRCRLITLPHPTLTLHLLILGSMHTNGMQWTISLLNLVLVDQGIFHLEYRQTDA